MSFALPACICYFDSPNVIGGQRGLPRLQPAQLAGAQVAADARGGCDHQLAHQVLKALRAEQRREELRALSQIWR